MKQRGEAKTSGSHESFEAHAAETGPSERNFGFVFTGVFTVLAGYAGWKGHTYWPWPALLALAFLVVTLLRPVWLRPLNRAWMRLGLILQSVTNPIILGGIFFLFVWPMGLVMRLAGRDPMQRKFIAGEVSYWVSRNPEQKKAASMKNQF